MMTLELILPAIFIFFFLVIGIIWFTPEFRLKFFLWRGSDRRATRLLEHLVSKNPERIALYTPLARIYYFENRRDKKALKIFETVLQLRLPFQWVDEILPIIAKYYIREGRKDSDAIRLIEKAVQSELDKLKW